MRAERIYYGAAYYDEYMPSPRVEEDFRLMREAGMNVIRVAESTWSTWEPREGEFDFTSLRRVLEAAGRHGLSVIVGTPTYAIPPWLARRYPDILAEGPEGPRRYGHRQLMDLTHPAYRRYAARVIERLLSVSREYPCVIGYQLDNETHHYDACSPRVQALFREALRRRFGTVEALNRAFGLAYWSNALGSWDDLTDVRGTINGSLAAEFDAFRRTLVTDFLAWQRSIVERYLRPGQFVTHNFDFEWRGESFALQPDADQFAIARHLDVAGCDIYHRSGAHLDGAAISFGGDLARSLKGGENYLVLETQAQGQMGRLPYPGQLRLQAFSHLASGAQMVEYWHWHSIHNAIESYWKGVLSHDLTPGASYREIATVGRDLERLGPHLCGLRRRSPIALLVSQRSYSGVKHSAAFAGPGYGDCLRALYDALFRLNLPCDILNDDTRDFSGYALVAAPCLYCAQEGLIEALRAYVAGGGHLLATFRSFFADEHAQIRHETQPYHLTDVFGVRYDEFTVPEENGVPDAGGWMELLRPEEGAEVLLTYDHPAYAGYAAAVWHPFGAGSAAYLGTLPGQETLDRLMEDLLTRFGISLPRERWPLTVKEGVNALGRPLRYLLNYSGRPQAWTADGPWTELLSGAACATGETLTLPPWGVAILEGA